MASVRKRGDVWRARYRDDAGREHASHFARKVDAQRWLDRETAKLITGTWTEPHTAKTTVSQWCDLWLQGYGSRRPRTVRNARFHISHIKAEFGPLPLSAVRPSHVRSWTARLREDGLSEGYVYALHRRLSQLFADAVHDGLVPRSPCSRRTSPKQGSQRPYVATTEQIWALHDAMPEHLRAAILLGAFAGLRIGETCGLRVADIDFLRGVVHPHVQYPAEPLKTELSRSQVPIPRELAELLSTHVAAWSGELFLLNRRGRQLDPETLRVAVRDAREGVEGLPEGFRYHDLRHYYASLLIASGADLKVVSARVRATAQTVVRVYGHLWPDTEESTREAVAAVLRTSHGHPADSVRTGGADA